MTTKYEWKLASFAKGINPNDAIQELERIEKVLGSLTPENVLAASAPEDALFHCLFTWDDEVAAHNYRLSQARTLINNVEVVVISDGQERKVPVFEIVRTEETKSYKHIEDLSTSDIQQIRGQAVRELGYWKNKLSFYKEFNGATHKIEDAINELGS
jgi:hypothetical protein